MSLRAPNFCQDSPNYDGFGQSMDPLRSPTSMLTRCDAYGSSIAQFGRPKAQCVTQIRSVGKFPFIKLTTPATDRHAATQHRYPYLQATSSREDN